MFEVFFFWCLFDYVLGSWQLEFTYFVSFLNVVVVHRLLNMLDFMVKTVCFYLLICITFFEIKLVQFIYIYIYIYSIENTCLKATYGSAKKIEEKGNMQLSRPFLVFLF